MPDAYIFLSSSSSLAVLEEVVVVVVAKGAWQVRAEQGTQVGGVRFAQGGEQDWPLESVQTEGWYTKPRGKRGEGGGREVGGKERGNEGAFHTVRVCDCWM